MNESTPPGRREVDFRRHRHELRAARARRAPQARRGVTDQAQALLDSARRRRGPAASRRRGALARARGVARAAGPARDIRAALRRDRRGRVRIGGDSVRARRRLQRTPTLDLDASLDILARRTAEAALDAAGVAVEATAPQELLAFGDSMPVTLTVYNRGARHP